MKRRLKIALGIGALLVLAAVGLWFGRPHYRAWKQERFLKQAHEYLVKADYKNASLCARKTLAANPANLQACRVMAQIAEAVRAPELVGWSQRIVDLEPGVLQNRLDLAKAAFVNGDLPRANKSLAGVDEAGRKTSAYHEMAALLAAAESQFGLSEAHYAAAAKMDPENKRLQLNLAVLHLQADNQDLASQAHQQLEKLSTDEKFRIDALRVLTAAAVHTNNFTAGLAYSTRLVADPLATFDDRLTHLAVLLQSQNPGFASYLAAQQKESAKKAEAINTLTSWMIKHQMADDALKWIKGLSADLRLEWPVVMATVDIFLAKKDWTSLEAFLEERKWGELEYARLGFLARVAGERKQLLALQSHWRSAIKEAGDRQRRLMALLQMAHAWKWGPQEEEILWLIVQDYPKERWILTELEQRYQQAENTRGLQKVYAAMMSYDTKDVVAKNNYAATSLLLKTDLEQAHRVAKEVYDQRPQDPVPVSTYAYSLFLHGNAPEALKVMQKLKPEQLETPAIAAYYGLALFANGKSALARKYLDIASHAKLLPEEKAMVLGLQGRL